MNRLENHYKRVIARDLFSKLAFLEQQKNQRLQMKKINLHISLDTHSKTPVKETKQLKSKLYKALVGLELLTKAKARLHFCNKAVGEIQLRKGSLSAVSVALRGNNLYHFLDQLVTQALPTLRPFENLKIESLDKQGSFTFSMKSLVSFPNLQQHYQKFSAENERESSLEISLLSSASKPEEALLLYSAFQLPFEGFTI